MMDSESFRKRGKEMVDYVADYIEDVSKRRVTANVQPGYMRDKVPSSAPEEGEDWANIMRDVDDVIMPGITHWRHPNFHALFPAGTSYPSILGDLLTDGLGVIATTWATSPACTELDIIVTDWVGKMIGLPADFLHEGGVGGGGIEGSASECILMSLLAARHKALTILKARFPEVEEGTLLSKLVAYSSTLANTSVEKAAMIGLVKMRKLEVDENFSVRGSTLQQAIDEDRRSGLFPFYVCATLGTTGCCSFDNIEELGEVCRQEALWLNVDAAYAGSALICPEFRYLLCGIENASSFNMNPHKWMLVSIDCSILWVKDKQGLTRMYAVDPIYLLDDRTVAFRNWGIALSRRFRSLKLWFVIRTYGVSGLQKYIREHIRLARLFEKFVLADENYEVVGHVNTGLVCFRLKGEDSLTEKLLRLIEESGRLHMTPAFIVDRYVIRFTICTEYACADDVTYAWNTISSMAREAQLVTREKESDRE